MKSSGIVCACCGKYVKERKHFKLILLSRKKYSKYWHPVSLELYFHIRCIRKVSTNTRNVYDLLAMMGKINGEDLLV